MNVDSKVGYASPDKLTDWANQPSLITLRGDFESARSSHSTFVANLNRWDDLTKGKLPPHVKPGKNRSKVQPKLIRRQAEWRYSALTEPFNSSPDMFRIDPATFEDSAAAFQNELLLNYQFRTKLNRVNFIDNLVRSVVDEGTGVVRVSWKRVTAKAKKEVPVFAMYPITSQEEQDTLQQAFAEASENPRGFDENASPEIKESWRHFQETGEMTVAKVTGSQVVEETINVVNEPKIDVLDPRNFYPDPNCNGDIDKAMFCVVTFETTKAELLMEQDKYKNLQYIDGDLSNIQSDPYHVTSSTINGQPQDKLRKRLIAYEYWGYYDIHGDGNVVPIVATWIGNTIIRMEENPYPDKKIPFVLMKYLPVKRSVFGEPDAELLEDNQNVLGALMRGMIDLLGRSANAQIGIAKDLLDPLNKRRFANGEDYEFSPQQNPMNSILEHKYPELPQSALIMSQAQNQEAEALTGVKSFSGGMSGEAYGEVAAGIRGVLDAASKREMAILRRIAKGICEIGQKIIAMNAIFLSEKEVVRVTNTQFVKINREDLRGNFDLKVDISTAEVDNNKAQDLAFLLQTIGNNLDLSITLFILSEICTLKRMPELAHKLKTFKKEPTPEEQEMMKLQIEEQRMKVEKLKSEVALNQARAEREQVMADQQHLDTVEQEYGVKHNREVAMAQAQAHGNQQLAITNALVKPRKKDESAPNVEAAYGSMTLGAKIGGAGLTS